MSDKVSRLKHVDEKGMAEPPRDAEAGVESDRRSTTGTPRWVKVFGIVALALVVAFVVLQLAGVGGRHGPGRHLPGDDAPAGNTPPPGTITGTHTGPPPGVTHP
jgi:hypothetical protein